MPANNERPSSQQNMRPSEILEFWFADGMEKTWFRATPEFDASLKQRFFETWQEASAGRLDHWAQTPEGALALVILLDQFPLNMFRNQPLSFSTEAMAIDHSKGAIAEGFDKTLPPVQKAFLYMPLMHSESLADQDRSVALYQEAGLQENLRFARHHRELISRFGRFPHRNAILGRPSTPEELDYLAFKEAFTG